MNKENQNNNKPIFIFDCDGVMCPPFLFAKALSEQHGITREMTRQFFVQDFALALVGKADVKEILQPYLKTWGWNSSADDFLKLWLSSERHVDSEMAKLVRDLRAQGITCCLATNQEKNRAKYLRVEMCFQDLFDELFISSELGAMKPDYHFFQLITKQLNANPRSLYFIDDQENYLCAAAHCGWNTYHFLNAGDCRRYVMQVLCA